MKVAQIGVGPSGFPTVSASQMRTYGVGGFQLDDQEEAKGCPRLWNAKYVERRTEVVDEPPSFSLLYGSMIHRVFYRMEQEGIGPEEALDLEFEPSMTPEDHEEALADLRAYMERGASPVDRFGTIAVEEELDALLYEDEEYGPIHFRAIVDWVGIDLDDPTVLRVVDYKTNRFPPSNEQVRGDVQLKGQTWVVMQNWSKFMQAGPPRVVSHLDAIKWRDVEMPYTKAEIDAWHSWAVAVVRQMLRDEEHLPVLNPGCSFCPISGDCPAFQSLPETGSLTLLAKPAADASDDQKLEWRDRANAQRLLLEKAVKRIDEEFKTRTLAVGRIETSKTVFSLETDWQERVDARRLHKVMGTQFYDVVNVVKGRLEEATADWSTDDIAAVKETITRVPVGSKVAKKKREQ